MTFRKCVHCGKKKALNDTNFRKYWSGIGGQFYLHTWCRDCEHDYQEDQRTKKRLINAQEAQKQSKK